MTLMTSTTSTTAATSTSSVARQKWCGKRRRRTGLSSSRKVLSLPFNVTVFLILFGGSMIMTLLDNPVDNRNFILGSRKWSFVGVYGMSLSSSSSTRLMSQQNTMRTTTTMTMKTKGGIRRHQPQLESHPTNKSAFIHDSFRMESDATLTHTQPLFEEDGGKGTASSLSSSSSSAATTTTRRSFFHTMAANTAAAVLSSMNVPILGTIQPAHAGGLLQFPPGDGRNPPLKNKYHFMRAGISELESEEGIWNTNALFLTNRENQLDSTKGVKQVSRTVQQLNQPGVLQPTVIYHSLAAHGMDTGDQIARELRQGRDRLLPEFTYLDPRGVGLWDASDINEIQPAIWAMDYDEAGPLGLSGRPPAKDDGTSNEVLHDQFIRLRQFISLQESRTAGDIILVIFPDGTGPALLSCMLAGIPFNEVHSLEFEPGEIRLDVTRESITQLWKERREDPTYLAKIEDGRQKLATLRRDSGGGGMVNSASYTNSGTNGNFVSKKDEKIEKERLETERRMAEKRQADVAREQAARQERLEAEARRRQEYEQQRKEQMEERQKRKLEAVEAAKQRTLSTTKKEKTSSDDNEPIKRSISSSSSLSPTFSAVACIGALGVAGLSFLGTGGEKTETTKVPATRPSVDPEEATKVELSIMNATQTEAARRANITGMSNLDTRSPNVWNNKTSTVEASSVATVIAAAVGMEDNEEEEPQPKSINQATTASTEPLLPSELSAADSTKRPTPGLYGSADGIVTISTRQPTSSGAVGRTEATQSEPIVDVDDVDDIDDGANDWLRVLAEIREEEDENEEDLDDFNGSSIMENNSPDISTASSTTLLMNEEVVESTKRDILNKITPQRKDEFETVGAGLHNRTSLDL